MRERTVLLIAISLAMCPLARSQPAKEPKEESDINRKRIEWFWGQRMFPNGAIPHEARIEAIRAMERMFPKAPAGVVRAPRPHAGLSTTSWTSIGPQPIGSGGSAYSGRVWALAVDPGNPAIVYAGTDGGGLWKTTDSGVNWTPLTDQEPSLAIASLALDPSNSSTIYAGTGGSASYGAGILKSIDGGTTWTQILSPFQYTGYSDEAPTIPAIAVSPANSQIVLAGVSNYYYLFPSPPIYGSGAYGIYRSTNGGSTWTSVLAVSLDSQSEILFDPSNPNVVYAGVIGKGVYKSTNSGQTWSLANGSGSTALPLASLGGIDIAVAPSASGTIYAALKNASDSLLLGFYKSTDGGVTWNQIGNPTDDNVDYWNWSLQVHPTKPNVVYAGSLFLHQSLDGGMTWSDTYPDFIHVDHHAQVFSTNGNYLYIGNDGGVWSTATPSTASPNWNDLNGSFATALFYPGISINPANLSEAFGGTQDNGTLKYNGTGWAQVVGGDGGWTAIDFTNPQTAYSTLNIADTWVWKTSSGSNWAPAVNGIDASDRSVFIPPLVMDPSNNLRLYFGTYRVYQTNDGASSWTAISGDLTDGGSGISTTAVAPSDTNTVYSGSFEGKIFVTRNAGAGTGSGWTDITAGLPGRSITQIVVSSTSPTMAYVTLSGFAVSDHGGHIWSTANAGGTWSNVTGNLPDVPVNDLVIDPDVSGTLYVATDIGVFRSLDSGVSWLPLGTGLPYVVVESLKLHNLSRTLRAGTYGRGAWDILVTTANQLLVTIGASVAGAPFTLEDGTSYIAPVTFAWNIGDSHTVTWLSTSSASPGIRYVFQGWSDGSSANPRAITVSSVKSYSANLALQFLLTLAVSPTGAGTVTVSPSSSDGFYASGANLTLTAVPNVGYALTDFSGGAAGPSPLAVTVTAPLSITAYFNCISQFYGTPPYSAGPGSNVGQFVWTSGATCGGTAASSAAWITFGTLAAAGGLNIIPYSIQANTGSARSATVTLTSTDGWYYNFTVNQDATGTARPNFTSFSPTTGSGASQIFTEQLLDTGGFAEISSGEVDFQSVGDNTECQVTFFPAAGSTRIFLRSDSGQLLGPLTLPSAQILENSSCILNGAQTSLSGSGSSASLSLGLSFLPGFAGVKYITQTASDSVSNLSSYETLGTWTAVPTPPTLAIAITDSGNFEQLQSGATYSISVSNSATSTPTTSVVSVVDTLPAGLTATSIGGDGWACVLVTLTCTRGDVLTAGLSYASIIVTVNVAGNASISIVNQAAVSGGGSVSANTTDTTSVKVAPSITAPASLPAAIVKAAYTATTVTAMGGSGSFSWTATGLPTGLGIGLATGIIAGTPASGTVGPYVVTVEVTDADSVSVTRKYSLTVTGLNACDVDDSGTVDVSDVQLVVNEALGTALAANDLNHDGVVNVSDLQIVINSVLKLGCAGS